MDFQCSRRPERLQRQMRLLASRGYRGVTFHEAVHGPKQGKRVAVTFDDAFLSVFKLAYPILSSFGFPGTVFVPTDYPDRERTASWGNMTAVGTPHEPELAVMSWSQLAELADSGWEIGSHTCSHPHLTQIDDGALEDELVRSRHECERLLHRPCLSIAYPFGETDDRVVDAAAAAGYTAGAALNWSTRRPGPLEWPRIGIYHRDGALRFRAKVSPAIERFGHSRAWNGIRRSTKVPALPLEAVRLQNRFERNDAIDLAPADLTALQEVVPQPANPRHRPGMGGARPRR